MGPSPYWEHVLTPKRRAAEGEVTVWASHSLYVHGHEEQEERYPVKTGQRWTPEKLVKRAGGWANTQTKSSHRMC